MFILKPSSSFKLLHWALSVGSFDLARVQEINLFVVALDLVRVELEFGCFGRGLAELLRRLSKGVSVARLVCFFDRL